MIAIDTKRVIVSLFVFTSSLILMFVAAEPAYAVNPTGTHDGADNSTCITTGWAYDPDTPSSSINVDIYRDGPAGGGGTNLGRFSTNVYRSDVNAAMGITGNHGFNVNLSAYLSDGANHTLYVHPIDSTTGLGGGYYLSGSPKTIRCAAPLPTVSVSVSPTSISLGQSVTFSWSSTNATSCTGSRGGSYATSGSFSNTPPSLPYTYGMTCTGPGGSATQSATVNQIASPPPTLNMSVSPTSINLGQSVTVSWSTTNATSCTGSRGGSYGANGSFNDTPSSLPYTYGMTCTGSGGSATQSVTVTASTVNRQPLGTHDGADSSTCVTTGWAYDPDSSSTSIDVHIYRDGPAGGGGTNLGSFSANVYRSDVNAAYGISGSHGFNVNLSSYIADGVSHPLYVYAIDTAGGTNPLISSSPKTIQCAVAGPTCDPPPVAVGSSSGSKNVGESYTINWKSNYATSCQVYRGSTLISSNCSGSITENQSVPGNYMYTVNVTSDVIQPSFVSDSVTVNISPLPQCRDSSDNDSDGKIDYPSDPGCSSPDDNDEFDAAPPPTPQCRNGVDDPDPEDTIADYPSDPGCSSSDDNDETNAAPPPQPQCSDGVDNTDPEDTLADNTDPGCHFSDDLNQPYNPSDSDETNTPNAPVINIFRPIIPALNPTINVFEAIVGGPGACTIDANPKTLIIPKNTSTLTWSCDRVISGCTLNDNNPKVTDIGAVASSGSRVSPTIDATTTFTLQCPSVNDASVTVRLFNPFLKEIIPQ